MRLETKSIASSAQPEKSLLGQTLLWTHLATWTFLSMSCSCTAWEAGRKNRETGAWSHFKVKESEVAWCWKCSWFWTQEPTAIVGTGKSSWNKTKQEGSQARAENWAAAEAEAAPDIPGSICQLHCPPLRAVCLPSLRGLLSCGVFHVLYTNRGSRRTTRYPFLFLSTNEEDRREGASYSQGSKPRCCARCLKKHCC